jgi:hypothetical protein
MGYQEEKLLNLLINFKKATTNCHIFLSCALLIYIIN